MSRLTLKWRVLFVLWITLIAFFGMTQPAYGYIDPATTSYIIQIVSGLIISLSVAFGVFFRRIQMFLITFRARLAALWVRLTSKRARELRRLHQQRKRQATASVAKNSSSTSPTQVISRTTASNRKSVSAGSAVATHGATTSGSGSYKRVDHSPRRQVARGTVQGEGKWEFLFGETRSFKVRLGTAALLAGAIAFTFIFFGVCDLFIANRSTLPYGLHEIIAGLALESLAVFVALTLVLLPLRGRLFDYCSSFFLGALIAMYIQGNFLNINLGQLNGDSIPWERYLDHALFNTVLCALIVLLPFILRFFSVKVWRRAVVFLPALLIVMQLVSLISGFATTGALYSVDEGESYLSNEGLYKVSNQHNIVVFVLDRLDDRYVNQVIRETPDFFTGQLEGFTRYTNNLSTHSRTFPSIINMLTGANFRFERPSGAFSRDAYQQSNFLSLLHEQGYTNYVYTERISGYFSGDDLAGLADNVEVNSNLVIDKFAALQKLTILSFYRYAPHALKPSFWLSTDAFYRDTAYEGNHALYQIDDAGFYANLQQQRLQVNSDLSEGVFHFIHLQGPHPPFVLDESGRNDPNGKSNVTTQTRASLRMVFEYIEQLKALGLYDEATIIITGDHGYPSEGYTSDRHTLQETTFTGLFYKPSGSSQTPLAVTDQPTNSDSLRSTVLVAAGVDKQQLANDSALTAPVYSECTPTTVPERRFFFRIGESGIASYSLEEFVVQPNARSFTNWKLEKTWPILYWQY